MKPTKAFAELNPLQQVKAIYAYISETGDDLSDCRPENIFDMFWWFDFNVDTCQPI